MTQEEWQACSDAQQMLSQVCQMADISDRKVGLFLVASCRRLWGLIPGERLRRLIDLVEQYVEGNLPHEDVEAYWDVAVAHERQTTDGLILEILMLLSHDEPVGRALEIASKATMALGGAAAWACHGVSELEQQAYAAAVQAAESHQLDLLRDLVGNPFRSPVALAPAWLAWNGGAVVRLAQEIYDSPERATGYLDRTRLAILADALADAGGSDPDLLQHCRGPGPHVRGCWVVDLCLGKK